MEWLCIKFVWLCCEEPPYRLGWGIEERFRKALWGSGRFQRPLRHCQASQRPEVPQGHRLRRGLCEPRAVGCSGCQVWIPLLPCKDVGGCGEVRKERSGHAGQATTGISSPVLLDVELGMREWSRTWEGEEWLRCFQLAVFFFFLLSGSISIGHNVLFPTWNLLCVCDSDWWVFSLTFPWPWSFSIIFSSFPAGGSGLNKPWLTRCGTTTGRFPVTMLMLMIASGTSDCLTAPMPVWEQIGTVSCSYLAEVSRSLPILVISVSGVLPLYHS